MIFRWLVLKFISRGRSFPTLVTSRNLRIENLLRIVNPVEEINKINFTELHCITEESRAKQNRDFQFK